MRADMNPQFQSGDRWRTAYRTSVVSILGREAPEVLSQGSRFYNVDRWTVRVLVKHMCDWAKANPGVAVTRTEVGKWVEAANAEKVPKRRIVIAATPAKLSLRVALALAGGGCHEAFHTRYSCRRSLTTSEVCAVILPRWAQIADWSKLYTLIQDWNNIAEDIRIERRGNEDYPGVFQQLCNLQDFILAQEQSSRDTPSKPADAGETLYVVSAIFRDLGLGYETVDQEQALALYRIRNPTACDLVEHGPLRPHLDEAISMPNSDDLGCLRVAMDVLIELSKLMNPQDLEEASELAAGNGAKPKCPKCGAPGKDLVVRPLSDGRGGKVKGRGVVTCTKCGWQETIDLLFGAGGGPAPDPEDAVKFEDMPQQPGGGKPDVDDKGAPSSGGPGDVPGGGDVDSEEGGGDDPDDDEGDGDDPDDEEEGDPDDGDGDDPEDGGVGGGDSDGVPARGAGGHYWDPERVKAWEVSAEDFLTAAGQGDSAGLMDLAEALESTIKQVRDDEEEGLADDERPWRPWTTSLDVVQKVEPSDKGREDDEVRSKLLLDSVRSQTAYLRAKLRVLVRSVEQRSTAHGVRRGKGLSERMLVDSVASIRSGSFPSRAYYEVSEKIDTSLAAVVIIDQSGSMADPKRKLQDAARCLIAITEPLDSIGSAVLVAGFRNGLMPPDGIDWTDAVGCHRYYGVCHDVFKDFHERFTTARWRFANTRGTGGTPMADGVQFGLDALSGRQEAHRALFIVTDGEPDPNHAAVIRHQIRLAAEARINIIGVGIGPESRSVMSLFPNHVWAPKIENMPVKLVAKLTELLDFRGIGRGRPLRKSV
jgi:hypothetical protein